MVAIKFPALFSILALQADLDAFANQRCTVDEKTVTIPSEVVTLLKPKVASLDPNLEFVYPHAFHNNEQLSFGNHFCNKENGVQPELIEFPILLNEKNIAIQKLYEYWKVKPKPPPGPCRIVLSKKGKQLCGVMCHETYEIPGGNREFHVCD